MGILMRYEPSWTSVATKNLFEFIDKPKRLLFDALDIPLISIFLKWMTCGFGLKKVGKSNFCEAYEVSLPVKAEAGMEKTVDFLYP